MKPAVTHSKPHTLRLHFNETPEDQALYEALTRTSESEFRTPITRQAKHLLRMALGLAQADLWMLNRIGESIDDPYDIAQKAAAAVAARQKPDLHLV